MGTYNPSEQITAEEVGVTVVPSGQEFAREEEGASWGEGWFTAL